MAIVRGTGVVFPEIKQIRALLKDYPKSIRRKYMKAAFNAAANIGVKKLKQVTPRGPTGNLKKSVVRKATANYGLAGYAAGGRKGSGEKKGYHQGFLEFGTGERVIRVPSSRGVFIASSFNDRKPFKLSRRSLVKGGRKVVQASPKYPKSFFKVAPFGQRLVLARMPVGGRTGRPPVRTAFQLARPQITSVLKQQMSTVLERANKDMARRARTG